MSKDQKNGKVKESIDPATGEIITQIVENAFARSDERSPILVAKETLTGDLRDAALEWIRALPKPWAQLTEDEQTDVIESVTKRCVLAATKAVEEICADGRRVIQAEVESVTVKDGLKATVKALKTEENLLYLGMAEGSRVQIVQADLEPFSGERKPAKADPSQATLPGVSGGETGEGASA